jgi:tetratricopeptide (TPR) repeat protein
MQLTLAALRWSSASQKSNADSSHGWTLDRNWDRTEGERLLKVRDYPGAESHLSRAAVEAEMKQRSASKRIHLRLLLAEAQRKQYVWDAESPAIEKLEAAEKTVRTALEIAAKNSERILYVHCLDALGEIYYDQRRYESVEKVLDEAIRIAAALSHQDPVRMARRVMRLGTARQNLGMLDVAIPALRKAVELAEQVHGKDHLETAHHLTELGAALRAQGTHAEAQECLRTALRIHQREGGINAPDAIRDLHHLAGSLEESGDLEGAAAEYERALIFKHKSIGSSLEDLAELQYGLASLYVTWQEYGRARELIYEAMATFRRRGGLRLAVTHETMAYVDECSGRYIDAVKELGQAAKIWETTLPERYTELVRNTERRIELLEQIRKRGEADLLRQKIEDLNARFNVTEEQSDLEALLDEQTEWQPAEPEIRVTLPSENLRRQESSGNLPALQ